MVVFGVLKLLNFLVTKEESTSGHNDVCSVDIFKEAFWEKYGQINCKTTISLFGRHVFLAGKRTFFFFWERRTRHPRPVAGNGPKGRLSVEFVNVGGWLTNGDVALDSCALFLAVAEQRLILVRTVGHQLPRLGRAMRVILPTGDGGVVHLLVVYGYQGLGLLRSCFVLCSLRLRWCCVWSSLCLL